MGRIVVAPDSFKGTASARDAAAAIARGWRSARPYDGVDEVPMADGGEGTMDALAAAVPGARRILARVEGPAGGRDTGHLDAEWLLLPAGDGGGPVALVELAAASGITLLDRLAPLDAHTYGFGQLIAAALDAGVERLLLAIGGSASTDGGKGALAALGARLRTGDGRPVAPGGRGLAEVATADLSALRALPPGGVLVLSDVTNPLLGPSGAAAVFAPQKGASPEEVALLESGLTRLAALLPADPATPGAGAAGGAGFGLLAWGATLTSGAAVVADTVGLDARIAGADLVITGEGAFDAQTAAGKAAAEVAARAGRAGVPVALAAGRIEAPPVGFTSAVSLTALAGGPDAAMGDPVRWLERAGAELAARFDA
ncbi:glycerate kinase [Naasia aerilata]|uniref:Glycerate kinase n=1 Tax=Naasia aerilata TaxID=1162966 RepID=A0ABM8GBW1_9MICO|nr:glycerate kinase [Naasia aerilata]BDZ45718.1 glycerate kinase [Naasia aerilata]